MHDLPASKFSPLNLIYVKLETLRLYPPILALPKWTSPRPQELHVGDKTVIIPPHTGVMPSLLAVQTHPQYWQDPLMWQPSRWIISSPTLESKTEPPTRLGQETLFIPRQSTFFPWSDGPQNCPGIKFAQVEFVAVLACLLRDHRVSILRDSAGESFEGARVRALAAVEDCDLELLLRMRDADQVRLVWKRA